MSHHFPLSSLSSLFIISALLSAAPSPARAVTEVKAYAFGMGTSQTSTAPSGPVNATKSGSTSGANTEARASADFGLLKVYAETHVGIAGGPYYPVYYGSAEASFRDTLLINSPSITAGSSGFLDVKFTIDGALSFASRADATNAPSPSHYSSSITYYLSKIGYGNVSQGTQTYRWDGTTTASDHSFDIPPLSEHRDHHPHPVHLRHTVRCSTHRAGLQRGLHAVWRRRHRRWRTHRHLGRIRGRARPECSSRDQLHRGIHLRNQLRSGRPGTGHHIPAGAGRTGFDPSAAASGRRPCGSDAGGVTRQRYPC